MTEKIVVIGAGIGGLAAAATLARRGLDVTVLEAHVYPGGCAGTFYHQGYRFDAGATLAAGFYPGGPMDQLAHAAGLPALPARAEVTAMLVHLPDGDPIPLLEGEARWDVRLSAFGPEAGEFWQWQEAQADALWELALRRPAWPPQTARDWRDSAQSGLSWLAGGPRRLSPGLLLDALRPVAAHLPGGAERLRLFVDAQLLISAQATSGSANALYGAAALDLARRGVVNLKGGMGAVAQALAGAVRASGGQVHFRQEAARIRFQKGRPAAVEARRGESFPADQVIGNLTPWNIRKLCGEHAPRRLRGLKGPPRNGWGAFMLYLGVDASAIPPGSPYHHQVVVGEPLGEGNSIYLSISPEWDETRAPAGQRAVTLSTHTRLEPWWQLYESDHPAYEARKEAYTRRMLAAAGRVFPGLNQAARLILPGTPVSFQRFTRRAWGWVGGFPQTSLLHAWGPRLAPGLWMVGDSIFPGQSVPAVALGGLRVAQTLFGEIEGRTARGKDENRYRWNRYGRVNDGLCPDHARHRP